MVRDYLVVRCEMEQEGESPEHIDRLEVIKNYFLDQKKPNKFNPYEPDNILMYSENTFEELVNTMQENGSPNPKEMTEFEWYSKIRYLEKKYKTLTDARK